MCNRKEPTVPIVQPELNEGHSEEGDYSRTMSQVEPQMFRGNNTDEGVDKNGCKYKKFMTCKTSYFRGKEEPIGVIDWISKMDQTFITYSCIGKLQTTYTVRQFKG